MKTVFLSLCALLLMSCTATTTDPSKGGLFSYNPEAYEQRKQERQERLQELQREQAAEERHKVTLTQSATEKQDERSALRRKLRAVSAESDKLEEKLQAFDAQNAAQRAALADLKARQARIKADIEASEAAPDNSAERQREAERLRREVERLQKDTEALSAL